MVNFNTSNPGLDQFQKTTKFINDTEQDDLQNEERAKAMPSKLKLIAGQADLADAHGKVAQATIGENIAQEKTRTQQGRSTLRSTDLSNIDKEMNLTKEMAQRYAAGFEAEGDEIAKRLGKKTDSVEFQTLKRDRKFWGATQEAIAVAEKNFHTPQQRQQFVEKRMAGWVEEEAKTRQAPRAGDGSVYQNPGNDPDLTFADTPVIPATRAGARMAAAAKPFSWEAKRDFYINELGKSPEEAMELALGRRQPNELDILKYVDNAVTREMGNGTPYDTDEQKKARQDRKAELYTLTKERLTAASSAMPSAPSVPAAPVVTPGAAPGAAPAGAPPAAPPPRSPLSTVVPPAAAQPAAPAAPVPDPVLANPAASSAPPPTVQAPQPAMPQLPKMVSSLQEAAQQPAGTRVQLPNGAMGIRVDTRAEIMALPPGTVVIDNQGRASRIPAPKTAQ